VNRPQVFLLVFCGAWLCVLAFAAIAEKWYRDTHRNRWSKEEQ
jgi:hypothetical protein